MNPTIHALLVDDEKESREVLHTLIRRYHPHIHITGEAASAEEAYQQIVTLKPQLVFLDIHMPRGDGFSLLKRFDSLPFEVIFVSSYDEYAISAIRFNALDYLLKPVEVADLAYAINKATDRIQSKQHLSNEYVINLLHSLNPQNTDKTLAVHAGDKVKMIRSEEIVSIEAQGRYCNLFLENGSQYTTARYLKDFEDYLERDAAFIRIGKSHLINARHIRDYTKGEWCIITMTNAQTFEVARRKKQEILERLKKL